MDSTEQPVDCVSTAKASRQGETLEQPRTMEQLIYEIACDELPYMRYSPLAVLQVQEQRRRRMEELRCLIFSPATQARVAGDPLGEAK